MSLLYLLLAWPRPLTRSDSYEERLAHREAILAAPPADGRLVPGLRNDLEPYSRAFNTTAHANAPTIWYLLQPLVSCPDKELLGGTWVCGARRLQSPCVIYSVAHHASGHKTANLLRKITNCEVHRFGLGQAGENATSLGEDDRQKGLLRGRSSVGVRTMRQPAEGANHIPQKSSYYELPPLQFKSGQHTIKVTGLPELMARMRHSKLALLYLDVWGLERDVVDRLVSDHSHPRVEQLCIQVYYEGRPKLEKMFKQLSQAGYRDFASTLHRSNVQQYSFVSHAEDMGDTQQLETIRQAIHQAALIDPAYEVGYPTFSCPNDSNVGWVGDGTKWLCNLEEMRRGCVVYSFGGSTNGQFEIAMAVAGCEVHTFDLLCTKQCDYGLCFPPPIKCHKIGLWTKDEGQHDFGSKGVHLFSPTRNLTSIMAWLGHSFLDVVKIDIEMNENPVFASLYSAGFDWHGHIGQLLLEVHRMTLVPALIGPLLRSGFAVFHREENVYCVGMAEFSLVSLPLAAPQKKKSNFRLTRQQRVPTIRQPTAWSKLLPKAKPPPKPPSLWTRLFGG